MIFHQVERAMHRARIREEMARTQDWSSFQFTTEVWESIQEEEGEFSWQGVMYDIVGVEQTSGIMHVQAYPDAKESAIARFIDRWIPGNSDHEQDLSLTFLKWGMSTFIPSDAFALPAGIQTMRASRAAYIGTHWNDVFLEVRAKPPVGELS